MKETREGQQRTSKRNPIKLSPDFPAETLQEKREWRDIVRVMKGKIIKQKHPTHQGSHSYSMEKIKHFTDKQKVQSSAPPNQLYNNC